MHFFFHRKNECIAWKSQNHAKVKINFKCAANDNSKFHPTQEICPAALRQITWRLGMYNMCALHF